MTQIAVVGSINMDLVTLAPRFPGPGKRGARVTRSMLMLPTTAIRVMLL